MRPQLWFCSALIGMLLLGVQLDPSDPYSLNLVGQTFRSRASGMTTSWDSKSGAKFASLGDCVSIATLKVLDKDDLVKAPNIRTYIWMVENAFSIPDRISREADKNPEVTMFLLDYLQEKVQDPKIRDMKMYVK